MTTAPRDAAGPARAGSTLPAAPTLRSDMPTPTTSTRASTTPAAAISPEPARGAPGRVRRDALIQAALGYAQRGWHVFPLRPGDKRPAFPDHPAERCPRRDPRCRAGHTGWEPRATTDQARIVRAWSMLTPHGPFGIGIATGPSRLVVVDLDVPKPGREPLPAEWAEPGIVDGADVWAALAERGGHRVPLDTFTVATPSGGLHLYFTAPAGTQLRCTAGTLAPMVDTRAHGGYVAAPPTRLDGAQTGYGVLDDTEAAPLPGWLAEALTPRPLPAPGPVTVAVTGDGRRVAYLERAITEQLAAIGTAAMTGTGRNRALYVSATALGQLVAGGELDAATVTQWLTDTALAAGLARDETARTIASGLAAGARRPRTLTGAAA